MKWENVLKAYSLVYVCIYNFSISFLSISLTVVSELWDQQCVRLRVNVKSDNCGENADCSGKGICFSNASMVSNEKIYFKQLSTRAFFNFSFNSSTYFLTFMHWEAYSYAIYYGFIYGIRFLRLFFTIWDWKHVCWIKNYFSV